MFDLVLASLCHSSCWLVQQALLLLEATGGLSSTWRHCASIELLRCIDFLFVLMSARAPLLLALTLFLCMYALLQTPQASRLVLPPCHDVHTTLDGRRCLCARVMVMSSLLLLVLFLL